MLLLVFVAAIVGAVVAAGIAVIAYLSWREPRARRAGMQQMAEHVGLTMAPTDGRSLDDFAHFEIFRRGRAGVAENTMRGTIELFGHGCQLRAGDFRHDEADRDGNGTTPRRFSYLIVQLPWRTPALRIRPERLGVDVRGPHGIDVGSDAFRREFRVHASDERFAREVLHARMVEFLLAERPPLVEFANGALCLGDGRTAWEIAGFAAQLALVRRLCELWPPHLAAPSDQTSS